MLHASDFRAISIVGRYAYGLMSVERLCEAWSVDDPFLRAELEAHWAVFHIGHACVWFDDHPFPRHPQDLRDAMTDRRPSADQVQSLHHAFGEARRVFSANCYSAYSDEDSAESLLNVVGVLARWGVEPPTLDHFRHATYSGDFAGSGLGERYDRSGFDGSVTPPRSFPRPGSTNQGVLQPFGMINLNTRRRRCMQEIRDADVAQLTPGRALEMILALKALYD